MFYAVPFVSWFKLGGKMLKPLIKRSPKLATKMAKITKGLGKNLDTIKKFPETVFKTKKAKAEFIAKAEKVIAEFQSEESV
jgi:hypothetical protein